MKIRKSITIDKDVDSAILKQAKLESRNFSNMIQQMAKKYLSDLKKLVIILFLLIP